MSLVNCIAISLLLLIPSAGAKIATRLKIGVNKGSTFCDCYCYIQPILLAAVFTAVNYWKWIYFLCKTV